MPLQQSPRQPIEVGSMLVLGELRPIAGAPVAIPGDRLVHLQLRRFAGCPVCDLHLRSFVREHAALTAAGIREVVVFHSSEQELREYAGDLPFAVVPDPEKHLYRKLGAEAAPRAVLDPRAWPAIVAGSLLSAWATLVRRRSLPPLNPVGGRLGLPADFLIAGDGRVLACKYGVHAADHWSVEELLARRNASVP